MKKPTIRQLALKSPEITYNQIYHRRQDVRDRLRPGRLQWYQDNKDKMKQYVAVRIDDYREYQKLYHRWYRYKNNPSYGPDHPETLRRFDDLQVYLYEEKETPTEVGEPVQSRLPDAVPQQEPLIVKEH